MPRWRCNTEGEANAEGVIWGIIISIKMEVPLKGWE